MFLFSTTVLTSGDIQVAFKVKAFQIIKINLKKHTNKLACRFCKDHRLHQGQADGHADRNHSRRSGTEFDF